MRVILEACDKGIEAALAGDERSDFDGGEKAVAGRGIFEKNDVSRLFTAKDVAAPKHFFEDVTIADIGAGERNVLACKNAFEAEVGHGSGNDAISGKIVLLFKVARYGEEQTVDINDSSFGGNEKGAVGVSIESDSERGALRGHPLLQFLQVERAATRVDIAAVRFGADADDVITERREEFRAKLVSGAIGAVKNDAKPFVRSPGDGTAAEEVQILVMERVVRIEIS